MMVVLGSVPLKPWRGPGEDGGAADGATSAKSGFRKRPILYSPEMEAACHGFTASLPQLRNGSRSFHGGSKLHETSRPFHFSLHAHFTDFTFLQRS